MIKDFSQSAVLTSQNPEAFINFRYESGDPSIYLIPANNPSIGTNKIFINGLDIADNMYDISLGYAIYLGGGTGDPSIASFHIYTRELEDFSENIRFYGWYNPTDITTDPSNFTIDVSIFNRQYIIDSRELNIYETSKVQVDGETSYLVLRTNPKFTGNIKVVVDSSNNLFLDTFKISDILNNKKYRKQKISGESVFSGDVRRIFSDMPLGELYRLDADDTLNISVPKTDLYRQYNVNYSYGARLFQDELYEDDYALHAPLWINSQLPDYFTIFRIDGNYNPESYPVIVGDLDLSGLANKYLKEGELIKSWGMKAATPIGTYLRNHLDELLSIRSPLFLSLSDPTQKDPDPNTWYGISVDKGIITGRSETPYFFDQKNNFTDTNAFISEGFERLNLLCPNLLNMEYVFSDNDVSLYTMHRYFGLYLTENELYEISYYAHNPDSSIQVLSLDGKDSSVFFNSNIFDVSGNIVDKYENRIFTLNDIQIIKRIKNVEQVNGTEKDYVEQWLNKPGENLFSVDIEEKLTNKFATIELNKLLSQGEHLRIIDKTDFKIWEVYGIDIDLLEAGEAWTYASESNNPGYPTVYRTSFSIKGTKSDQIQAIKKAFDIFVDYTNTPFETRVMKTKNSQLSFEIKDWANDNDIYFQRLTSQTVDDPNDPSSNFNAAANYNDIKFYGVLTPTSEDFERVRYDASYGPIDFELFGDRNSITINFINTGSNYVYSFDTSLGQEFAKYTMYMSTDNWYRIVEPFEIYTKKNHTFNYVLDPNDINPKSIINTSNQIYKVNGKWNAYETYPLIISLMGINPVKDMDFTVYDQNLGFESEYWYKREDDASTYAFYVDEESSIYIENRNSYEIISGDGSILIGDPSAGGLYQQFSASPSSPFTFNTFDNSVYVTADKGDVTITYNQIDGLKTFKSYKTGYSEENINTFYRDPSIRGELKYGLTVPYVTKWVGLGNDCRNNPFRLILDVSIFDDASTNFIPFENNFKGEITYPSFKYLSSGDRAWGDYIFYDINDVIEYKQDSSTLYTTLRDLMFTKPYVDVFSKLVYSNHKINATKLRSSIVYFNDYKESIDTLINGLSLSLSIDNNAKNTLDIQDWDRFKISFISTPSRNKDSNYSIEVFINENTETILIVWYQGADVLNYNKRNSTYFGGRGVIDSSLSPNFEFQGYKNDDKFWSFIKTPFIANTAALSSDFVNIYDIKSAYDASTCSPFNQLNWNFGDSIYSVFNANNYNIGVGYSFEFFERQYNTFAQYVNYEYVKNTATFGDNIFNHGYTYMQNLNIYKESTCELEILKEILISNSNIGYYIFRKNLQYNNQSFSVPPIQISINNPRSYKNLYTYNGWYRPKFNNILDFNYNEELDIVDAVEKDFTFSNTNFKEYHDIPQYWYNKVVSQVTAMDVSTKDAIGYIENFNVFKSQWDGDYYIESTDIGDQYVDGFNSTLELPSYFGSKLVKLPESLVLDEWDTTTSDFTDGRVWHELEFNLTRRIVNMFKTNSTFTDNWAALTTSDNVIDGYIKQTILGYYNISKPKIKVEVWSKTYNGTRLSFTLDSTFTNDSAANIDGNLVFINSEYLYKIKVPVLPNKTWYVKFKLFEK